ncbi:hypothetical protein Hdeb2414_s0025g00663831 [Helianthus debilis subsp. tardiflorus]
MHSFVMKAEIVKVAESDGSLILGAVKRSADCLGQVHNLLDILHDGLGDIFLSMLPTWHAYERACYM